MGLSYSMRKMAVMRLETGRTANPTVETLGRFLRACGALWSEVTDLLGSSKPVEIDTKPIEDSEFDVRDKQRMEWAVERQVRKFEARLAAPIGGKPLHPGKQAETVRKLRNYRIVANIIEQAVNELLKNKPVSMIEYPRFKMVAREAVGMLWREARRGQDAKVKGQKPAETKRRRKAEGRSKKARRSGRGMQNAECRVQNAEVADKLIDKAEYWGMQKLDRELVREVQEVVVGRFAALKEANPELF
jgi:transcriptional regulator with XRE-family HTH domain